MAKYTMQDLVDASLGIQTLPEKNLIELCLTDDAIVSWYACKSIGALSIEEGIPALMSVLAKPAIQVDETNTDRRLIAAWSIGKFPYETVESYLSSALASSNELLRLGAADAYGELRDSRAIPLLGRAIASDSYEVALWASLSLAKIGTEALPVLESMLSNDIDDERKIMVTDAIYKLRKPN